MVRRLISPFVVDRFTSGGEGGSLEAATLFADVSGFGVLTSTLMEHGRYGSEVVAQVMSALFTPLVDAVYSHGGAISGFAGDSFTALFPADGSSDDERCALRALAAATEMREHLAAHGRHETPWGAFEIGVKLGLAAGTVHWQILRQRDERAAYYVRGPAIDGCAAIDEHAAPGDLVLHPSSRSLLGDRVSVDEIPGSAADGYDVAFARVMTLETSLPDRLPVELPGVDAETIASFLPREVVEQTEVGEYRQVVNVFVNLQGDPDDAELRSVVQVVRDLQTSYGGVLNRIAFGDKGCNLLLFWGAPVSFENDAERAVHFILDLQRAIERPLRAGVTTGISYAGLVGSDLHAEFTTYGLGINLAARLMTSAPWGSIWMDAAVHRKAAPRFVTSSIGHRTFKGFAEPEEVFGVTDRRTDARRRFGGDTVGRAAESAALTAFVAPLLESRFGGVLVVQGEAGMGKSRLVGDFLRQLDESALTDPSDAPEPLTTVRAVTAPTDAIERRPFHPFRYWLRQRFGRDPRAPDHDNKVEFEQRFDALLAAVPDSGLRDELDRVRSIIGALVDLHWEGSLVSQLDGRNRYEHTVDAITHLLLAESLCRPLVLVLEDVHWIDAASAEVVRRLVGAASGASERHDVTSGRASFPLAVLVTARQLDDTPFDTAVDHQLIALSPFGRTDMTDLSTQLLGAPPTDGLLDLLMSRTGGNPFFAEQLLRHLRDERQLRLRDREWTVDRSAAADAALPTDIKSILMAQLDRLGQSAREVAQAASVLGREFSQHELIELLGEAGVERAVAGPALEAGRSVGIWAPIDSTRWAFRHVLLRDAAYDVQLQVRRATLHHRAATMLERIWRDDLETHYVDISRHFESACHLGVREARGPAADFLAKAGAQAANSFASSMAADLFTRALTITPDDDVAGRFQLLLEREWVNDAQGDRSAQAADVDALQSLAERSGDLAMRAEASMRRSYLTGDTSDFVAALAASDHTVALARTAFLPELEAAALRTGGAALRAMGRFDEAVDRFEQALAVAQGAQLEYQEATAWTAWSSLIVRRGRWKEAAAALERVAITFERSGRVMRRAHALAEWGLALSAGGQLDDAEACFERAIALTREVGDPAGQIRPLYDLAEVLIAQGDFVGADVAAAESVEVASRLGNHHQLARALITRGRGALLTGDRPAAHRLLTAAQSHADGHYSDLRSCLLAHRAALALLDERPDEALDLATEAAERAHAVDDRIDSLLAVLYRSLAAEALGHTAAAEHGFREVIEIERAMETSAGRAWDGHAGLVRLLHRQGRLDESLEAAQSIAAHLMTQPGRGAGSHGLGQCEQPLRVHLSVAVPLLAAGDARGDVIVSQAASTLAHWAGAFDDPVRRQQLLEIPYHREIVQISRGPNVTRPGVRRRLG